jgi:alpha-L-fucosidase 2
MIHGLTVTPASGLRARMGWLLCVLWLCPPATPAFSETSLKEPDRGFVSTQPATSWEQALISGNGRYGAMVLGQPTDEVIVLNHARLFMPLHPPLSPVDTASHLAQIRQMMSAGQYQKAADYVVELSHQEGWGGKRWTDPFIPAFDLQVTMATQGAPRDYARSVDFSTGLASVAWRDDRGGFLRRLFVSRPDDVVVLSITGPAGSGVDCRLQLEQRPTAGQGGWGPEQAFKAGIKDVSVNADGQWLTYHCTFRRTWPGSLQGYEGAARIVAKGGTTRAEAGQMTVTGATEVLVLLRIGLLTDANSPSIPALKKGLSQVSPDFGSLLRRHAKVHGEIFDRLRLDLDGGADRLLTSEELIAKSHVGALSRALVEKEFDACRYAILSSSGELLPNLQGIWNGAWGPPWSSDFTQNGNVQTAIAADLSANMAECLEPYFRYLESQMADYRQNARRLYGCRGIHVPSRTSSHGLNNHFDETWPMTFWTAGAGWAAHFYYDYYLYTGDRNFLRRRALPFMKEAAAFYEDFLIEGPDGRLLFSPSYSPENNPGNSDSQACTNATMDIAVARELLANCIAACGQLKTDAAAVRRWKAMLAKMPDYQVNADGAVKEWATPLLEDHYEHRHASHLYPLFYGMPKDIAADPQLCRAFARAIEKRMEFRRREPSGEMAFGVVQLGQAAASLRQAETCYELVDWLANLYWRPAMTTTHNRQSLFNVDICGGMPDVICRMLLDSRPGQIDLLPSLPAAWPKGSVKGLRARGGFEVDITWRDGRLVSAEIRSMLGGSCRVRCGEQIVDLKTSRGGDYVLESPSLKVQRRTR